VKLPGPEPWLAPLSVTQSAPEVADQLQPAPAVTDAVPVPPPAAKLFVVSPTE
jgi:hypothetical protein